MEYVVYAFMMMFGSIVWAWVIAALCGILATLNPHSTAFQNTMDELEYFMRERNFPMAHKVRLRDFFRQTQDFSRLKSYDSLMVKMSVQLRGDTAVKIGMTTLSRVWYFSLDAVEKEFLAVVALNLYGAVYDVREVLPTIDLTVIMKGMAARKLRIFAKGATLGTDCVIPDERQNLRELDTANCLTFVQTSQISRNSLITIVEHFPVAKAHVKKAAAIYTLRAAFRQSYRNYKSDEYRALSYDDESFAGQRSFAGMRDRKKSCARIIVENKHHRRMSFDFQQILSSVERSKDGSFDAKKSREPDDSETKSFLKRQRHLRVRGVNSGANGGYGGGGAYGDGLGGGLDFDDDDHLTGLRRELALVRKGQEAEAKRSSDLLARNEVLEIKCGALDDKLELMLSMLSSMRSGGASAGASAEQSFAGAPDASPSACSFGDGKSFMSKTPSPERMARRKMSMAAAAQGALAGQRLSGSLRSSGQVAANGQRSLSTANGQPVIRRRKVTKLQGAALGVRASMRLEAGNDALNGLANGGGASVSFASGGPPRANGALPNGLPAQQSVLSVLSAMGPQHTAPPRGPPGAGVQSAAAERAELRAALEA